MIKKILIPFAIVDIFYATTTIWCPLFVYNFSAEEETNLFLKLAIVISTVTFIFLLALFYKFLLPIQQFLKNKDESRECARKVLSVCYFFPKKVAISIFIIHIIRIFLPIALYSLFIPLNYGNWLIAVFMILAGAIGYPVLNMIIGMTLVGSIAGRASTRVGIDFLAKINRENRASLRLKTFTICLCLILPPTIFLSLFGHSYIVNQLVSDLEKETFLRVQSLEERANQDINEKGLNVSSIAFLVAEEKDNYGEIGFLSDKKGNFIIKPENLKLNEEDLFSQKIKKAITSGGEGNLLDSASNQSIAYVPIADGEYIIGASLLFLGTERENVIRKFDFLLIIPFLALSVWGGFCGHFYGNNISQGIMRVDNTLKIVAAGDLTKITPVETPDELGELAMECNRMVVALRASKITTGLIFDAVADGITLTDMEGKIVDINPGAVRQIGFEKKEVIGKTPLGILIDKKDSSKFYEDMKKLSNGEIIKASEYIGKRKNGTKFPLSINLSVLNGSDGNPQTIIAVHRDITEEKEFLSNIERTKELLEEQVDERTKELKTKIEELERFNKLTVGRELKMLELKEEIKKLKQK